MKYEITKEDKNDFEPFSIKLTFETREEFVNFHDNIASLITDKVIHPFHGDVFKAGRGEIDYATGEI